MTAQEERAATYREWANQYDHPDSMKLPEAVVSALCVCALVFAGGVVLAILSALFLVPIGVSLAIGAALYTVACSRRW